MNASHPATGTTSDSISIREFTYHALPMRVVFGPGSAGELTRELDNIGLDRVLVLCSPEQRATGEDIAAGLGERSVGVLARAEMHVPAALLDEVRSIAEESGASGYVAVGGGSAIGLGKALALESGLAIVAVPTTYAGSEMTPIWGITEDARKRTGRNPSVLPRAVVYDPMLTMTLPVDLSVTSGVNAMAHAVEALYAPDGSPIIALMAQEGVRALTAALPTILTDPSNLAARSEAQYGAWLCGACLGATTMSLHHKLCHSLGGTVGLPHSPTHTVVLPYVVAFNAEAAPDAMARLSTALGGTTDPGMRLWDLLGEWKAPRSLRELGMTESDIELVVDEVTANPYWNPRPVDPDSVRAILTAAWSGAPPARYALSVSDT